MAYEIINVRLTRNNPTVHWGFSLGQVGRDGQLSITRVDQESMAEKSGIQQNDLIQEFFDAPIGRGMNEVNKKLQTCNDITMVLKRFVPDIATLPWNLTEAKDGQIIVDHWDQDGRVVGQSDRNTNGYINSFKFEQQFNNEDPLNFNPTRNPNPPNNTTSFSNRSTQNPYALLQQLPKPGAVQLPFSNTSLGHSQSSWDTNQGNVKKHFESTKLYSRTDSSNAPFQQGMVGSQGQGGGLNTSFGVNTGVKSHQQTNGQRIVGGVDDRVGNQVIQQQQQQWGSRAPREGSLPAVGTTTIAYRTSQWDKNGNVLNRTTTYENKNGEQLGTNNINSNAQWSNVQRGGINNGNIAQPDSGAAYSNSRYNISPLKSTTTYAARGQPKQMNHQSLNTNAQHILNTNSQRNINTNNQRGPQPNPTIQVRTATMDYSQPPYIDTSNWYGNSQYEGRGMNPNDNRRYGVAMSQPLNTTTKNWGQFSGGGNLISTLS